MEQNELNPRDLQLLKLMALGLNTKEIAGRLKRKNGDSLSPKTIEYHINGTGNTASLAAKLGTSDRTQLVRLAVEQGLVRPGESLVKSPINKAKVLVKLAGIEDMKNALLTAASMAASSTSDPIQITSLCQCSDAYIRLVRLQMDARYEFDR